MCPLAMALATSAGTAGTSLPSRSENARATDSCMAKDCKMNSTRTSLASRLRDCALKVRRWPKKCLLEFRIWLKWLSDKRHLPLSRDHWDLYAVCHRLFHYELSDFPNLVAPRDFNDRIQWLKLFDQSVDHTRCADKSRVRDYIRE